MIWWRRFPLEGTIDRLYGTIVAQARLPCFYTDYGVPDTVDGRFEMIVLHQALVTRRAAQDAATSALGPALFDRLCRDLDHNLREMGVGDLTVPKRMRAYGEAYFGRARAYDRALGAGDDKARAVALARNVFGLATPTPGAWRLACYLTRAAGELDQLGAHELASGLLRFPDPADIAVAAAVLSSP
jgi:cytochrome b pre-mRNA-processing protein 3